MVNQQRRVSLSYRVSMRRSIAPKRSHRTDSDALSVIHEGSELTNRSRTSTANDGRPRADTQSAGLVWKKTTKPDHSNRRNDSPTLFFNDKRSTACTIQ